MQNPPRLPRGWIEPTKCAGKKSESGTQKLWNERATEPGGNGELRKSGKNQDVTEYWGESGTHELWNDPIKTQCRIAGLDLCPFLSSRVPDSHLSESEIGRRLPD
jgi:hypothetical protein